MAKNLKNIISTITDTVCDITQLLKDIPITNISSAFSLSDGRARLNNSTLLGELSVEIKKIKTQIDELANIISNVRVKHDKHFEIAKLARNNSKKCRLKAQKLDNIAENEKEIYKSKSEESIILLKEGNKGIRNGQKLIESFHSNKLANVNKKNIEEAKKRIFEGQKKIKQAQIIQNELQEHMKNCQLALKRASECRLEEEKCLKEFQLQIEASESYASQIDALNTEVLNLNKRFLEVLGKAQGNYSPCLVSL